MLAPERIGKYDVFPAFARGGMASVHVGRLRGPSGFSRLVAIKRLHPVLARSDRHKRMLLEEARLCARIESPYVVRVFDVLLEAGDVCIVMELVRGVSLAGLLASAHAQGIAVPPAVTAAILSDALRGLHAAHEAKDADGRLLGIVHRDVSPQNVIVGRDGISRVLDFGIAKALGAERLTVTGEVKGKLGYMSPEQLRRLALTRQSDIYSAGVVLWEALVGERALAEQAGIEGALTAATNARLPAPSTRVPGLTSAFDEVTAAALAREPRGRFANAEVMALAVEAACTPASRDEVGEFIERVAFEALEKLAAAARVAESAPESPPDVRPARAKTRPPLVGIASALALLAALVLGVRWGRPRADTAPPPPAPAPAVSTPEEEPLPAPPIAQPAEPARSAADPRKAPAAPPRTHPVHVREGERKTSAASCNPPYEYDARGKKHYKPECVP